MSTIEPAREDVMAQAPSQGAAAPDRRIVSPTIAIRRVPLDAPYDWLAKGWRDLWSAPAIGLSFGFAFAAAAVVILLGLYALGMQSLILVLTGGFLLIGPLLAVGLYDTSRRLQAREPVSLGAALTAGLRAPGQLGFMGAILLFAFFVWVQFALLLFMLFHGSSGLPPLDDFLRSLVFTPRGLALLVAGTAAGAVLAAIVFSISVVSVPLLLSRRVDAVTAMSASVAAVRHNPGAMMLWAALIVAIIAAGIATCLVGLAVAFPLIGHATWHASRDLVVGED